MNELDVNKIFQTAIIDLRSNIQFNKQHLKFSCNITLSELEERIHELPDKRKLVSIIGEKLDLSPAEILLRSKGYTIQYKLIAESFFSKIKNSIFIETGETSHPLWQPSSVVKTFIDNYFDYTRLSLTHTGKDTQTLNGIDLACGSGRDAVFMALNGWKMTGVDYLSSALDKAKNLAKNNHCAISTVKFDLEKENPNSNEVKYPKEWINNFDSIVISRYLHRPLLKQLDQFLRPGGFIIYQTFLLGCEKFGSPKNPRYLLKEGELAKTFSEYAIKHDKVEYLADGRPTNSFIAQKRV